MSSGIKQPTDDWIVLRPELAPEQSAGGVFLPQAGEESRLSQERIVGTVEAVGPGAWSKDGSRRLPLSTRCGDRVLVHRNYGGGRVKIDGETFFMVRDSDAIAILAEGARVE